MSRRPRFQTLRDSKRTSEVVEAPKTDAPKKKTRRRRKKADDLPAVEAPKTDATDEMERIG